MVPSSSMTLAVAKSQSLLTVTSQQALANLFKRQVNLHQQFVHVSCLAANEFNHMI
jgi:hypothetical protein